MSGVAQLVGGERDGEEFAIPAPEPLDLRFVRAPTVSVASYRDAEDPLRPVELDEVRYRRAGLNDRGVRRYVLVRP